MRILIHSVNFWPELTGVGKYTGELADWLAGHGHQVRVVTAPPFYPGWRVFPLHSAWRSSRQMVPAKASDGTMEVFRCPVWVPRVPRGWKRVLHLLSFSLGSTPAMLRQISWLPDIVLLIAPTLFCSPQALCTTRLTGAVGWLHVQDFEVDAAFELKDFSSPFLRRCVETLERSLIRRFDRTSAVSERMLEGLCAKGVDASRSIVFPNWVNTSVIYPMQTPSPLRGELGIPEHSIVALYSGSMGKKQGLELVIEASRRLAFRSDIQFVFSGDGPDRETFAKMAQRTGRIMLLPLQPNARLNELLNLADIHLLPQLADAADLVMPSKLTGMMASGRAIIATARASTQVATVVEGRGVVTAPGDVDEFVRALVDLAEDRNLRLRMGKAAREYAIEHLDHEQILGRFERSMLIACGELPRVMEQAALQRRQSPSINELAVIPGKAGDD
ncbi:MAG: colanic acid biosynthesis glycosyltransferase WcaI [Acidobacteria bacterium]|nr:MAG: colanic acid biosynthesis glycosyltransferase WcaI [Acidobacteriota bacterium]